MCSIYVSELVNLVKVDMVVWIQRPAQNSGFASIVHIVIYMYFLQMDRVLQYYEAVRSMTHRS